MHKAICALILPMLLAACRKTPPVAAVDAAAAAVDAAAAPTPAATARLLDASTGPANASTASTAAVDAGASSCRPTQVQTDACISTHADLGLDDAAVRAWITSHGAAPPTSMPEACRETSLTGAGTGPGAADPVLVCLGRRGDVVDHAMGIDGPVLFLYDLEVLAVRKKKLATILKEPFAIGDNGAVWNDPGTMYFSADVTTAANALELVATPADCTKTLAALPSFFEKRKATLQANTQLDPSARAQLIRATGAEEKQSAARITAICHAAGHYAPGADGKMAAKK